MDLEDFELDLRDPRSEPLDPELDLRDPRVNPGNCCLEARDSAWKLNAPHAKAAERLGESLTSSVRASALHLERLQPVAQAPQPSVARADVLVGVAVDLVEVGGVFTPTHAATRPSAGGTAPHP